MNYKSLIILVFLVTTCFKIQAQTVYNISKTQKKCLMAPSKFDFETKFEWIEVDCSELENVSKKDLTNEQVLLREQEKIKLLKYQKKLKSLGYVVEVTGILDDKTIKAHNHYLKKKIKVEKRNLRKR